MSIVASVKVFDGIVLGAESMTQLYADIDGQTQYVKSYENARKLFQIGDLPFGILTYGGGNIGQRSIESFLDEFSRVKAEELKQRELNLEAVAQMFFEFMSVPYTATYGEVDTEERPVMGFFLAGYSQGQHLGSEFEFVLPAYERPARVKPDEQLGASWRGISVPFTRLFYGIDPRMEDILTQAEIEADKIARVRELASEQLMTRMAFNGMPIQDAIKFCRFIIETTIGSSTYEVGTPTCGGPIHIAVITRTAGFRWVHPPSLIEAITRK